MFITPWGVELSENIQNLQIGQVEDKEKVEKRMRDTNPYISSGIRYGCWNNMIEDQYFFRVYGVWNLDIKPALQETSEIFSSFPIRLQRYFRTKTQYHEFLDIYRHLLSYRTLAMLLSTILSWPSKTKEALKFSPLLKYLNKIKTILGYLSM